MAPEGGPASDGVKPSAFGCITVPFLLLAAIPLGWGARARWADGVLLRTGVAVEGRVTELVHAPDRASITFTGQRGRGGHGRTPVVAFRTATGVERTAMGSINRDPPEYAVGDAAVVVYDPADPARADVRSELERWRFWLAIWTAVSLVPATIAAAPLVLMWRDARRAR